jgi:hypothetical protein
MLERAHDRPHRIPQPHIGSFLAGGHLLERGNHLGEAVMNCRPENRAFIREVVIDSGAVHAGLFGDGVDGGAREPIAFKHGACGLEDHVALRTVLRAISLLGGLALHRECGLSICASHLFSNRPHGDVDNCSPPSGG